MSDDRVWTEFQGVVDGTEAFHAYAFLGPIRVSVSTSTRLCHVGAIILGFLYISIHILAEMDWTIGPVMPFGGGWVISVLGTCLTYYNSRVRIGG